MPFSLIFPRFVIDFPRKIDETSIKNHVYFFIAAFVFLNMATLTKHRILRYESYFFIFCVLRFLIKKHRKNNLKCKEQFWTPKSTQNCPRGSVLGPKMVPNSRRRDRKSPKLCETQFFYRTIFGTSFGVDSGWTWGSETGRLRGLRPEGPGSLQPKIQWYARFVTQLFGEFQVSDFSPTLVVIV